MTNIQINGQRFETATEWTVDAITVVFTDAPGNPTTSSSSVFDPDGPNAGMDNLPGASVNSWTDTLIDFDFDGNLTDEYVMEVIAYNVGQTESIVFDVNPDAPVVGIPSIESYYIDFYDLATSPPSFMPQGCGTVATANAVPSIFFYSQNMLSGGADGVRLVVDGVPVDYIASVDPQFFSDGVITDDGFFLLADPALAGTQVTAAQPLDNMGNPVGISTPLVLNYNTATSIGIQSGDPNTLEIVWDICHEQPTQVFVQRCTPNSGQTYYDPLGPQAGSNPVGATIVQWDTSGIVIEHPAVIGAGDLNFITTYDQNGRTLVVVGDPLPTV